MQLKCLQNIHCNKSMGKIPYSTNSFNFFLPKGVKSSILSLKNKTIKHKQTLFINISICVE